MSGSQELKTIPKVLKKQALPVFYGAKKYFTSCVAGSRPVLSLSKWPPPYRFTEVKAFAVAEVLDLGRVIHTKFGIPKLRRIP